jgi:tyrosyl-tRNA synthetase
MLREIGKHFTIDKKFATNIVKRRLDAEVPITFLEFNYMLQAYDLLEISRRYDRNLQMGGSDQWGNNVQGVELCRRVDERKILGVTQPLLENAAGQKRWARRLMARSSSMPICSRTSITSNIGAMRTMPTLKLFSNA